MSLSLRGNVSYGLLEVGVSGVESFLRLYLLIFYTDRIGIDPRWAGLAIGCGVLWDAAVDPLIGLLCDRTKTRYGSRIPWMVAAAPCFAVSLYLLFAIPSGLSDGQKIAWLIITNILVNSSMAALSIPHLSLGADMAESSLESTKLYAWRMLMSVLGLLVGIAVPAYIRSQNSPLETVDRTVAIALGVISVILSAVTIFVFAPKARAKVLRLQSDPIHHADASGSESSAQSLRFFLTSKSFVALMIGYGVATLGQGLNSSLALYYYTHFLRFSELQLQKTLLVFMVVLVLSLPLWVLASKRVSKHNLLAVGVFLTGVMTFILYPLLPPGRLEFALIAGVLGGVFLGGIALFESHLVDLMHAHGLNDSFTGRVFGLWKFLAKTARAVAIATTGLLLSLIGYQADVAVSTDVAFRMALLFGPLVGFFFIFGGVILKFSKRS